MSEIISDTAEYTEQLLRREFVPSDLNNPQKVQQVTNIVRARFDQQILAKEEALANRWGRRDVSYYDRQALWMAFQPHLERLIDVARRRAVSEDHPQSAPSGPNPDVPNVSTFVAPALHVPDSTIIPPELSSEGGTLRNGTIHENRICLNGRPYKLTYALRDLLAFLLEHEGSTIENVINHFGFTDESHLHKRLNDLRNRLSKEMKDSSKVLSISSSDRRIYCQWTDRPALTKK